MYISDSLFAYQILSKMKTPHIYIIHPENNEQEDALKAFVKALKIKFETAKGSPYDPDFVHKILESRQQVKEGKTEKIKLDDICK